MTHSVSDIDATDYSTDSGGGSIVLSPEQVALSLLSQFNEYHLPRADELIWLVSEKDAPQAVRTSLSSPKLSISMSVSLPRVSLETRPLKNY